VGIKSDPGHALPPTAIDVNDFTLPPAASCEELASYIRPEDVPTVAYVHQKKAALFR
jgi:hypothetical protein